MHQDTADLLMSRFAHWEFLLTSRLHSAWKNSCRIPFRFATFACDKLLLALETGCQKTSFAGLQWAKKTCSDWYSQEDQNVTSLSALQASVEKGETFAEYIPFRSSTTRSIQCAKTLRCMLDSAQHHGTEEYILDAIFSILSMLPAIRILQTQ